MAYRGLRAWWFLRRPTGRAALVAVCSRGRVLLIRNSYRGGLTFPGGNLDRGETPAEAAARELREEVGVAAPVEALRFVEEVVYRDDYKRQHEFFFVLELPSEPALVADRRELAWARFVPLSEAPGLALRPLARRLLNEHLLPDAADAQ